MPLSAPSLIVSLIIAVEHLIKAVNALQESSKKNRAAFALVTKELTGVKSMLETLKSRLDKETEERTERDNALELRASALETALAQEVAERKTGVASTKRLLYWSFGIALGAGASPWIYILLHR